MTGDVTPAAGDVVWIRRRRWRVEHLRLADRVGIVDAIALGSAEGKRTFLMPFDRVWPDGARGRLRHARWPHARARLLAWAARAGGLRLPLAALTAAVDVLPFQLEAALAIVHGARRVLLADAVGLGKTIQAGLVIAEVVRRTIDPWVLVLVPASLRDQWADELSRRFRIVAEHADAETLRRLAADLPRGGSPWRAGVWIATADFLKQPHVLDALPLRPWDLIVLDEAHDAAGRSDRHDACDALARRSRRVLLLTATPHNGDSTSFDRLCQLGQSASVPASADRLTILRRTPASLGWSADRRTRWHRITPSPAERAAYEGLLGFERDVLRAADERRHGAAVLFLAVLRKRALSTMAALAASLTRRSEWLEGAASLDAGVWQQPRFDFGEMDGDGIGEEDDRALAADVGLGRSREQAWIRRLLALTTRAAADDSRVRRVVDLVRRGREPAVVFTEFRDSLSVLIARIARTTPVTAVHGGQSAAERRAALAAYLDGQATILVATDVAGQGLNLQTRGRWVVNFDLPWNPARLAQRAGRVDRIGQTRSVHVTLFAIRHGVASDLLHRLSARAMHAGDALDLDLDDAGWPDERTLASAIVTGRDAAQIRPPLMELDVTWRRAGHWVARDIVRRRLWSSQWREPDEALPRPMITRTRGAYRARASSWVFVYSTPITDGRGALLETSLGAFRVSTAGAAAPARDLADSVGPRAVRRAERRARRIGRWLDRRDQPSGVREDALARELERARLARLPQPGLFDRRASGNAPNPAAPLEKPARSRVAVGRAVLVAAIAVDP